MFLVSYFQPLVAPINNSESWPVQICISGIIECKCDAFLNFSQPMTRGFRFDATKVDLATAREKQNELNELKSAWMLRRVKANTIGDNLPRKTDQIVFCSLSPFQVRGFFNYLGNKIKKYLRSGDAAHAAVWMDQKCE